MPTKTSQIINQQDAEFVYITNMKTKIWQCYWQTYFITNCWEMKSVLTAEFRHCFIACDGLDADMKAKKRVKYATQKDYAKLQISVRSTFKCHQ